MAHEFPDIPFAVHGPVDEPLAYTHAGVIHEALEKVITLEASLPPMLLRPFKRGSVEATKQRIENTGKKAGREFDAIQAVVEANRRQGRVITSFFDYSPDLYDVNVGELSIAEHDYSLAAARAIWEVYDRPQTEQLQVTTLRLFDSLSAEPQPTGASVLKVLDMRHLYRAEIGGQLKRNKKRDPSGDVETHAIVFPQQHIPGGHHASGWDYPDQDIDQDQRSLAVHYSRRGSDVTVSLVVAIQADKQDHQPVS